MKKNPSKVQSGDDGEEVGSMIYLNEDGRGWGVGWGWGAEQTEK